MNSFALREPEENLNCPELIEQFNNFRERMENAVPMGHVVEIIGAARMNNEVINKFERKTMQDKNI